MKRTYARRVTNTLRIIVSAALVAFATLVLVLVSSSAYDPTENRAPALRIAIAGVATAVALSAVLGAWRSATNRAQRFPKVSTLWTLTLFLLALEWAVILATGRL
jgi:hypothetical protein